VIAQFLGLGSTVDTMTARPLPLAPAVTVAVVNGTGAPNQATETAAQLSALGFKAAAAQDAPGSGLVSETVVTYSGPDALPEAEAVVHSLSGVVVMARSTTSLGAAVVVVTGSDFRVHAPVTAGGASPTPAPSVSSGAASAAPAPNNAITSRQLTQPTSPVAQLEEWDPRSCTATGRAGP
jgi:hypothetical protein